MASAEQLSSGVDDPPRDEWFENDRNLFGPGYDHAAKNKGLRLRLASDGYYSLVQAILRPPRCPYSIGDLGPKRVRCGFEWMVRL